MNPARARRRLGSGLVAFGLIGLILLAAAAALVLDSLSAIDDAASSFDRQQTELVAMLRPASAALATAAASAANAGTSLTTTSAAADRAGILATNLADSFDGLAALGSFELFGARPFAGLSQDFGAAGADARALATDLRTAAASLRTNAADAVAVAANLRFLATQLETLVGNLDSGTEPGSVGGPMSNATAQLGLARLVLIGLIAWLAVPALASTVVGWRMVKAVAS
ncbi:MAG TPA: hypothetical protein VMQ65_00300 [Candidatus Limnocylindria bacterium]|nr:hypothetical protein [Candidatus Limnocylindria bacterium]